MSFSRICFASILLIYVSHVSTGHAQLSKGNLILIDRGLQVQGLVQPDDNFSLSTYTNANYTALIWSPAYSTNEMDKSWNLMSRLGAAPGFPWGRWVQDPAKMPPLGGEAPYTNQLVNLSFADESRLEDSTIFNNMVNWFNTTAAAFPNTIRYINNWGGQIEDGLLSSFISQAHPDLISFDTYPYKSVYDINASNHIGAPIGGPNVVQNWYGELRRYRAWGTTYNIPFGIYRQTFHAVEEYVPYNVYRNPSPSELRLNTFAALAFNAKMLIDFTYNSGASSLFERYYFPDGSSTGAGDNYPNALYAEQADINLRGRNLGKALVRLKPVYDIHNPTNAFPPPGPVSEGTNFHDGYTTSIMFLRGKYLEAGVTNFTGVPNSFHDDPSSSTNPPGTGQAYTWWETDKNDPYLRGWAVTNKAGVMNNGLLGEVILSWLTPIDETFDGPTYSNQVYVMVVNGLTATNGTAADCLQEIKLNFLNVAATTSLIMLDSATGQLTTNGLPLVNTRRQLTLSLNGGDAAFFKFNTGAPFVGFYPTQAAQLNVQMQTNIPVLTIQGTAASRYRVETTSSLSNSNWTVLTNFLLPSSSYSFQDMTYSNAINRFYRVVGTP